MKTVIIVSKCLRVTKFSQSEDWYDFHFKGVCAGMALRKVQLKGKCEFHIRKGEEYLMYVQMIACEKGVLKGTILKARLLDECWDRS